MSATLSQQAQIAKLRKALMEARTFAEWPAGSKRLEHVLQIIDEALAATEAELAEQRERP